MNKNEITVEERYEQSKEQKKEIEQKLKDDANKVISILKEEALKADSENRNPISAPELAERSGLKEGRLHAVIKYMRRCSEEDLERYIRYYPISTKKGYYLPRSWSDFVPFYITMFKWYKSLERTIEPCRVKMEKEKIPYRETMAKLEIIDFDNYLNDIMADDEPQMNKHTSWFMDDDDD